MSRLILQNFSLSVDGIDLRGKVENFTPPKLMAKTEEVRLAGMGAPFDLDMGHEKYDCTFSLLGYDPQMVALVGLRLISYKDLTFRGALLDEVTGQVTQLMHRMYGKVMEVDHGEFRVGEANRLSFRANLLRFSETHDGRLIHSVDVLKNLRVVGGIDQNLAINNAIGI